MIIYFFFVGLVSAVGGIAVQSVRLFGDPQRWEYLVIGFVGLGYALAMTLVALWVSTLMDRARVSVSQTWGLALFQSAVIFVIIALLP